METNPTSQHDQRIQGKRVHTLGATDDTLLVKAHTQHTLTTIVRLNLTEDLPRQHIPNHQPPIRSARDHLDAFPRGGLDACTARQSGCVCERRRDHARVQREDGVCVALGGRWVGLVDFHYAHCVEVPEADGLVP